MYVLFTPLCLPYLACVQGMYVRSCCFTLYTRHNTIVYAPSVPVSAINSRRLNWYLLLIVYGIMYGKGRKKRTDF